jgi:putative Mg2+ transporter-C (MgtC) family protein
MQNLAVWEALGYVAVAMGLGAGIGFERELADKPAGMRTHMLVAGAAALFVLLGEMLVERFDQKLRGVGFVTTDPIRLIEAIVAGVAFLGAGTILRRDKHNAVHGLTTAATLLFTAAIGVCVAVNQVGFALGATLLALLTLRAVHLLETWLKRKANSNS